MLYTIVVAAHKNCEDMELCIDDGPTAEHGHCQPGLHTETSAQV